MANAGVEASQGHDGVRDLKSQWEAIEDSDQKIAPGINLNRNERDFARTPAGQRRTTADEIGRRVQRCNPEEAKKGWNIVDFTSNFVETESWFHYWNGNENPFNGLYKGCGKSESLVARFLRNLPVFDGFWHIENLLTWIDAIDDFFEELNPPEHVKCQIVFYKMKGAAYYWWKMLQKDRFSEGKSLISSWPLMKRLLVERFMPTKDIEMEAIQTESCSEHGHSEEKGPANELYHTATIGKFVKLIVEEVGQSTGNYIENENSDKNLVNEQSIEKKEMKPAKCSMKVSTESNTDNSDYLCLNDADTCKVHISENVPYDVTDDSSFFVSLTLDACKVPKCGDDDALIVDKEENAQLVASELDMKKSKSEFDVAAPFLVSVRSTGEQNPIVTETRMIIPKLKLGSASGLESIVEEWNEAFSANFIGQTLQGPPIPVATVDRIYRILHDQVSHKHEEQCEDKWPKWVNRFGGGSFSDDNKNLTCLLNGMRMVPFNVDHVLVLFLFDPGGYIQFSNKWGITNLLSIPKGLASSLISTLTFSLLNGTINSTRKADLLTELQGFLDGKDKKIGFLNFHIELVIIFTQTMMCLCLFLTPKETAKGSNETVVFEGSYDGCEVPVRCFVNSHHDAASKETLNVIAADQCPSIVRWHGVEYDQDFVHLALVHCECILHDLLFFYIYSHDHIASVRDCTLSSEVQYVRLEMKVRDHNHFDLWKTHGYPPSRLLKIMKDVVHGNDLILRPKNFIGLAWAMGLVELLLDNILEKLFTLFYLLGEDDDGVLSIHTCFLQSYHHQKAAKVRVVLSMWYCRKTIFEVLQWLNGDSVMLPCGTGLLLTELRCLSIVCLHFSHVIATKESLILVVATGALFIIMQLPISMPWTHHFVAIKVGRQSSLQEKWEIMTKIW